MRDGDTGGRRATRRSVVATIATVMGVGRARAANSDPTADFDWSPSTPVPDENVTFDASDSTGSDGSIESYDWAIERSDGYADDFTGETTTLSFDSGGNYEATLTVTDDGGATDSRTRTVTVDNSAPTAAFDWSPSPPVPDENVTFDASAASDPDGNITGYDWEIERSDGYADDFTGETVTIAFDSGGNYEATLTVTDNGGRSTTETQTVTVDNSAPTAAFDWSPSPPVPDENVSFNATGSSDSDGDITDYDWEIERSDGYADDFAGETTTLSFDSGGNYEATLTVTDNGGRSTTKTRTITVENASPTPSFATDPEWPMPGDRVTFDATASSDADGTITDYDWEIERSDGYADDFTGETTTVTFDSAGSYEVTLTVTDNGGKTTRETGTVLVGNDQPSATFSYAPEQPVPYATVEFDASGSEDPDGRIRAHEWEIDGRTVTGTATSHQFEAVGTYLVTLVVTDDDGRTAEATERVTVGEPTATATATETTVATDGVSTATEIGRTTADSSGVTANGSPTSANGSIGDPTPTNRPGRGVKTKQATEPTTPVANSVDGVTLPTEFVGGAAGIALLGSAGLLAARALGGDGADGDTTASGDGPDDPTGGDPAGGSDDSVVDELTSLKRQVDDDGQLSGTVETELASLKQRVGGGSVAGGDGATARSSEGGPPTSIPTVGPLSVSHDAFEKHERIGAGGNADVHRATIVENGTERPVALKEPRFQGTLHREVADRFATEAELWAGLDDHDGVVTVLDWDDDPLPWIAMEYMDGGSLAERGKGMGFRQAAWTASQVAGALEYAHGHGVAHLDLKPANVLFRETADGEWDAPKVADWGLARLLLEHSRSVDGISPQYAAPEQFDDSLAEAGRRTDIYQLGAVCYDLFTGRPPFDGRDSEVMYAVLESPVTPPTEHTPELPPAVDEVLGRALAKNPDDRYRQVSYMRDDLRDLFTDA